ncbi:Ig-like domain-containing protein, partial [Ihuprevotella massiliensis]|uniref:Ig-like domain-containing protein n=1 Tax=Ihuprevotella massiliensis TaxID=1852368 RepID=UPI0015B5D122
TQVVLNETQHHAIVDDVFTLTANVMPEKAAQYVVWTMDRTDILQDLGEGKFKALKAGEVIITATAQDGSGMKATCRVVVKNPMATQVVLNKTQHNAIVDDVFTLTAKVMPEKAAQNVVWTMDKTNTLQDLGNGKFKALKAGEVTITATAQDGSGMKATCHVVVKNPMATQVVLNETQHHAIVDDVFTLTANVMPEKAAQYVVWTMDRTDILQDLGEGKFKALKAGEVIITATAQDGSGMKATCRVVVKNPMATQVVLNKTQHNAIVDDVFTLTAKVMPEKAAQNVVWTMDKTNTLQDLGNGKFKALKAGEVTITATAQDGSGMKATCHVVVKNPMATQVVLNETQHHAIVDDVFTLTANVMPEKAAQYVVWTMDRTDILQDLGEGKFKALKAGEVIITATAQDGSGMKATCRVVVKNPMATQVVLNKTQHNAIVDDVFTLTAKVMPEKAAQNVVWTMDKTNTLQDLGNGKFKALKAGEVTITATAQDGSGMKATCHVVVKNPMATQVVLNETQHHAIVDDVFTLTANVMPEKAAQYVVWTMDRTDILQDLGEGKFKALKAGEVIITATAQDGSGMKATCRVVVKNPMATQVVLNKTQHNAIVDDVFTLTAKVMPEKAAQNVVWTMDKTNILQDLGEGKFKALKTGEVTITATAQDGSGMKATCRVVVKNPKATQVVLNASNKFVYVEEIFTLNANILPEKAVQKVNWELSNATIVESLGDGRFLALREGRTTITAVATDGSGVRAVCHVVVQAKKPVVPEIPKATEVVLDSLQRTVHAEEEFTLIAKVMPEQAVQKVVWTMDKTDILQDLGEGKFKALKTGVVTITATAQDGSGVKATCHVTVIPPTTLDLKKTDVRHSLHWEGATLVLRGAKPGSIVRVYSMKGKKLHQLVTTDSEVRIDFGLWQGVYLLETNDGFRRKVVR